MEPRFGADFSGVRLHTDSDAAQLSQDLNAQAFTRGGDVYMGAGKYNPGTTAGNELLAHELTHVVQQGAAQTRDSSDTVQTKPIPAVQRASTGKSGLVQRALDLEKTNWSSANAIFWAKGMALTGDLVAQYRDGGSSLWVKKEENPEVVVAQAEMIAAGAASRNGRLGGNDYKVATPQVRLATPEDRAGMTKKLTNRVFNIKLFGTDGDPKATRKHRLFLADLINTAPLVVATNAGGQSAEIGDTRTGGLKGTEKESAALELWKNNPQYVKALGYAAVLDIINGNFDRLIGMLGTQNWKVDIAEKTIHMIDNFHAGNSDSDFAAWSGSPWVTELKAKNFKSFWTKLGNPDAGYWAGIPAWEQIPGNQKEAWFDTFLDGMREAVGDLPTMMNKFRQSWVMSNWNNKGGTQPQYNARLLLFNRIKYLLGLPAD